MLQHPRGRRSWLALLPALFLTVAAGCDRLLVEPPAGIETSIALSLSPSAPNFAVAPANADLVRVQVLTEGGILFDDSFPFDPSLDEILVPIRFAGSQTFVSILVEIKDGTLPLLRGSTEAELVQRRVVEAPISMRPAFVVPFDSVQVLTAGVYHSCGLADNTLMGCWGVNDEGQLGDGSVDPTSIAVPDDVFEGFYEISAGLLNTCAIGGEGQAYCWGSNRFGGLGTGASPEQSVEPVPVSSEVGFVQISVGGLHACGLTRAGDAFCWGYNRWGQLGDGSTTTRFTPVPVATELRFSSISAGYAHTCGVVAEVGTYCWGLNSFGQLGDGSQTDQMTPTRVGGQVPFFEVSAGGLHTCGLGPDNMAYCWGFNRTGQLGNNGSEDSALPQPVGASYSSIVSGGLHTCAIDADGSAWCWGFNGSGALGDGSSINRAVPTPVAGSHGYLQLAAGLHHTCGMTVDRNVLCWGYNRFGQVGDGTTEDRLTPGDVLAGERFFHERQELEPQEFSALLGSMADGTFVP